MTLFAAVVAGFVWALIMRFVYVVVRWRGKRPNFWSWWLIPLTVVFAALTISGTKAT